MGFGEAILTCYRKYADFTGRARRSEYWFFALFEGAAAALFVFAYMQIRFGPMADMRLGDPDYHPPQFDPTSLLVLSAAALVFLAANLLPSLAVSVRRLHDLDFSGWWLLLFFVLGILPLIGIFSSLLQFIWFSMAGTRGDNRYGPDPKGQRDRVLPTL